MAACTTPENTDGGDPTNITMLVLGDKPTNGHLEAMLDKLNERLIEQANATLDLYYIEWADWQTQYNVQLLSGDDNVDLITHRDGLALCVGERREGRVPAALGGDAPGERTQDLGAG